MKRMAMVTNMFTTRKSKFSNKYKKLTCFSNVKFVLLTIQAPTDTEVLKR